MLSFHLEFFHFTSEIVIEMIGNIETFCYTLQPQTMEMPSWAENPIHLRYSKSIFPFWFMPYYNFSFC